MSSSDSDSVEAIRADILRRLSSLRLPDGEGDPVSAGMVSPIVVTGRRAFFSLLASSERISSLESLRTAAESAACEAEGIDEARVVLSSSEGVSSSVSSSSVSSSSSSSSSSVGLAAPGVSRLVAVASGKGGVGKSTSACNLAAAFAAAGLRAGLLDADVYGPSLPRLLGLRSARPEGSASGGLKPIEAWGFKAMSIGFMIEEATPMIWRGPMVSSAIGQLLSDVEWGDLDVLFVDMPPGTGDAQLTLAQKASPSGAVIVTTPQELSLLDARKGAAMFDRAGVPTLGVIENMSGFECPSCGAVTDVFSRGGALEEARRLGVEVLGSVPLSSGLRAACDAGAPPAADPESELGRPWTEIARRLATRLDGVGDRRIQV